MVRIVTQRRVAITCAGRWRHQVLSSARRRIQKTVIAMLESENVRKTLIEYMTTSWATFPGVGEREPGGGGHQEHAVAHGEALGERGEAVRKPGVRGHVGHDARPVEEAGLRGDEEQQPFAQQRGDDEARPEVKAADGPVAGDPLEQEGIEGLVAR